MTYFQLMREEQIGIALIDPETKGQPVQIFRTLYGEAFKLDVETQTVTQLS